jgi:hypothetical protein
MVFEGFCPHATTSLRGLRRFRSPLWRWPRVPLTTTAAFAGANHPQRLEVHTRVDARLLGEISDLAGAVVRARARPVLTRSDAEHTNL